MGVDRLNLMEYAQTVGMVKMMDEAVARVLEDLEGYGDAGYGGTHPFDSLIATVLSHNTTDEMSGAAFERIRESYFDGYESFLQNLVEVDESELAEVIEPCGLYNVKAGYVKNAARMVDSDFESVESFVYFVRNSEPHIIQKKLTSVSGVGRKTADIILVFAGGHDGIVAVDTHVHRVAKRLGFVHIDASRPQTADVLSEVVPPERANEFHEKLIKHGREVCRSQNPRCDECVLSDMCYKQGLEGKKD